MVVFNEDSRVKFPTIKYLMEMGYEYISFKGVSYKDSTLEKTLIDPLTNILIERLKKAYFKLNPTKSESDFDSLISKIQTSLNNKDLGKQFYNEILLNPDERIIDLSSPENFRVNNTFQLATELTCGNKDSDNFRPDITLFINGLPLAFIEVKKENNSKGIQAETERMKVRFKTAAFRRYLNITQIMVFSNDMEYAEENRPPEQGAYYATIGKRDTKYSTFREDNQHSFPIKLYPHEVSKISEELMLKDNNVPQYINLSEYKENCKNAKTPTKRICNSLFSFDRFHFLLKYGIAYADYSYGSQKHIMRYPQLFATKAIEKMLDKGGQKGIIWHTQGSGKTALAYYNVKYLTDYYHKQGVIPQFFFIVDRLDLMDQAQMEFTARGLKVVPVQDKDDFKKIISSPFATQNQEGKLEITVVNIQKFSDDSRVLSKSAYNLQVKRIYFIDEAHRNYNPKGSFLKNLISSDENAVMIALTGTPIIQRDINTKDIFGDYIHTYYYNESISDGYTLRLLREKIDSNFSGVMKKTIADFQINPRFVKIKDIYAHKNYVEPLLDYIVEDLKKFRAAQEDQSLGGMIVCNSKEQAKTMYQIFLDKYTDRNEVETTFEDGEKFIESVGPEVIEAKKCLPEKGRYRAALILCDVDGKDTRKAWIELYKEGLVDFLIVYQMLQTGFDAPRLKKLYLNRNVRAHNLLQTLTRVNRPYKDQKYGYVVDFADIEEEYEKTNGQYQKELEDQNGKEFLDNSNKLFVTEDEAQEQIAQAVEALEPYNLQSATSYSKQLNMIDDTVLLNRLNNALNVILSVHNMLLTQGSDVDEIRNLFEEKCNFAEIKSFIKATKLRIASVNYMKHGEEAGSAREMLNIALEDLTFNFEKNGEPQLLELAEQYKQSVEYARSQLLSSADPQDPEFISLQQAFLDEVAKHGMANLNDPETRHKLNMHDRVKVINDILNKIRRKNEEDNILAAKYKGDKKYVRIEKRMKEKAKALENAHDTKASWFAFTKNQRKIDTILLNIKEDVDDFCLDNDDIITVEGVFTKKIKSNVTRRFRQEEINTDSELRSYVTNLIEKEYKNSVYERV